MLKDRFYSAVHSVLQLLIQYYLSTDFTVQFTQYCNSSHIIICIQILQCSSLSIAVLHTILSFYRFAVQFIQYCNSSYSIICLHILQCSSVSIATLHIISSDSISTLHTIYLFTGFTVQFTQYFNPSHYIIYSQVLQYNAFSGGGQVGQRCHVSYVTGASN